MFFTKQEPTKIKVEHKETPQEICEKMYGMGSDYLLSEEECSYEYLAQKIVEMEYYETDESESECNVTKYHSDEVVEVTYAEASKSDAKDLSHRFTRKKGYIEQIKNYLDIDFEKFDDSDIKNKREKIKIIYLLHTLKPQRSQEGDSLDNKTKKAADEDKVTNILKLISSLSMENVDTSVLGVQTYNGEDIKAIREKLGKEISRERKKRLHDAFLLCTFFDFFLKSLNIITNAYSRAGHSYKALRCLESAEQLISRPKKYNEKYELSPIEMFYFRIIQFEEAGNIKDILFINSIEIKSNYNVPPDMIEEMKKLAYEKISYDEIDDYVVDNINEIASYVFLKRDVDRNALKRLKNNHSKVKEVLEYFNRTNFTINVSDVLDKLYSTVDFNDLEESGYSHSNIEEYIENFCRENLEFDFPSVYNKLIIVSACQAILLDEQGEIFEYTFSNYRKYMNIIRVQAALKTNQKPVDALKAYWTRKIMDHLYANIGQYELRRKLRELENVSDNLLKSEILICTGPTDMEDWLEFYIYTVVPKIINMLKDSHVTLEECEMLEPYFKLLKFEDYFEEDSE